MKKLLLNFLFGFVVQSAAAQTITNFVNQNTGMPFVDGSTLVAGAPVTVQAICTAPTSSVVFSKDGVLMKSDVTDPYSFTWSPVVGAHIMAARPWNGSTSGPAVLIHFNVIYAPTPTPTATVVPTPTPTATPTPTQTPSPTPTPTPTGTPSPSQTPTSTPTPTPTVLPTVTPTPLPTPSGTATVTFKWDGTADTLWYGAKSEAVVQNYTGVICAPATTCTGTAYPLSHSLVLPVGVNTVKVAFATGQHYYVVVSNAGGNSNLIEFDL